MHPSTSGWDVSASFQVVTRTQCYMYNVYLHVCSGRCSLCPHTNSIGIINSDVECDLVIARAEEQCPGADWKQVLCSYCLHNLIDSDAVITYWKSRHDTRYSTVQASVYTFRLLYTVSESLSAKSTNTRSFQNSDCLSLDGDCSLVH